MSQTLSQPALSREEKQFLIMTQTPIGKLVARLSVPTVISMLVSAIYNITDTFYVAHLGESAAGAVGVVFSLMSLIQALGMGVGMGASSLVSRCLGRRDPKTASKYVSSAFFFGAFIGLCILFFGEINVNYLMRWLGSTETILPYACAYGHYILIAAPVMCSAFVLNTTLRAEGKAVFSMIGLSTGALLNIAIAPIFIYTLDMGIAGAAIAVLICQSISLCILLSFFLRKKSVTTLSYKLVSRNWRDYWNLVRLGSPTTLRQGFASLAMALLNIKAAPFGDAAVAAMAAAYGTRPERLRAAAGPAISIGRFEVGDEVYDAFAAAGLPMERISRREAKWHIDLGECNRLQLIETGLSAQSVSVSDLCTYSHADELFSARRLGTASGRLFTGIMTDKT